MMLARYLDSVSIFSKSFILTRNNQMKQGEKWTAFGFAWVAIVAVVVFTTRELPFWLWVLGIILLLIVMFVPTDD
jgi:hypothetical protein